MATSNNMMANSSVDAAAHRGVAVELDDVSLRYMSREGETEALSGVSLGVAPGEVVAIVGPSGCGKSTCLSLVAGLMAPSSGRVLVNGEGVQGPQRSIGYMLQRDHLLPWRTILENALLGAEVQGADLRAARENARELLQRYGLEQFENSYPDQMSGGMRQRAALIRTLVTKPAVLLLDEPFSALDFQTRLALTDEMAGILREEQKTTVLVTHDIGEAIVMADRVIVMTHRPGRVKSVHAVDFGDPSRSSVELRSDPAFTALFNQIWNELDVHVNR